MAFATSGFGQFMASGAGRLIRIVAGIALIAWGWSMGGTGGIVLVVVGLAPLAAGTFDFCILSALFGGPFWGKAIRAARPTSASPPSNPA